MKKTLLYQFLLVSLFSISLISNAQFSEIGKPFIENFSPKDYKHENQNFSIIQDTTGVMYFGNLDGVMQFDGQSWRMMPFKGKPYLSILENGRMFVGGYQSFGELINTSDFKMKYEPMSNTLWKAGYKFDHVVDMINFGNNLMILAPPHLFLVDSNMIVEHILSSEDNMKIFGQSEPLVLLKNGLFKIDLQEYDTIRCPCDKYDKILNIIPFKDQYLIHYVNNVWKIFDKEMNYLKEFDNEAGELLSHNQFVTGIFLSSGMFAFATENCGIVIVDKEGRFITHINQNNGLMDNDIYELFEDNQHNLWVAMNNGISLLNYPAVFTLFDKDYGIQGSVKDVVRFNDRLFVATSQGLYASPINESLKVDCEAIGFVKIKGVNHQCRKFLIANDRLFVSSINGLYEFVSDELVKHSKLFPINMIQSSKNEKHIYAATQEGLYVIDISDGFKILGKFKNLDEVLRTVIETKDGDIWTGTNYNGVFHLDIQDEFSLDVPVKHYKESNGLPQDHRWIDVITTQSGILFSTYQGVFKFNTKSNSFVKHQIIDTIANRWYYPLIEDEQAHLWFSSGVAKLYEKHLGFSSFNEKEKRYISSTHPFSKIRDYSVEVIYPDQDSITWFGAFEGLLRFDRKKLNQSRDLFGTTIRMIRFGKDSIIDPNVLDKGKNILIKYKNNNVYVQVTKENHQPKDEVMFQYQLEGLDEDWSAWLPNSREQFLGLKEGKYVLKVRSKNISGQISETTEFAFKILPPYYRTLLAYVLYLVLILSFLYMLYRYRAYLYAKEKNELEKVIRDKTEEIVMQKERAEDLVKSILPEDTARELQSKGKASRKKYDMVTVLFSDIQGFTEIAEDLNQEKLLDELDQYVLRFDKVVGDFNIEKIKTIGDAYMCAGGIPRKNRTNPIDVVLAGLQMIKFAQEIKHESEFDWGIRFGVHTGPVIAGVVGSKKITYDIWGDTVNIASRMESYGEIGQLNISELTYAMVLPYFDFKYRGKIPVKYKGNMNMYFVTGLKKEYALDKDRILPNKKFELKMQNIRFETLEDVILTKLEKGLDKRLYYHNVRHTMDVINQVEIIGLGEGVSDEEMILLKTAALFHDLGHTISYVDHEEQGIIFAKDILPDYSYSASQIEIISELIYATKFPPEPRSQLEEIICDADLDYLGRTDFLPSSNNLYLEMFEHGRIDSKKDWNKIQVSFLKTHHYYTETARKARNVNKQDQLDKLVKQIEHENESF